MRVTWVVGVMLLFLVGSLISLTIEGIYMDTHTSTMFAQLTAPDFGQFTNPLTFAVGFFNLCWDYLKVFLLALIWDYSFLVGPWEFLRYVGMCLTVGMIVSIIMAMRGTST